MMLENLQSMQLLVLTALIAVAIALSFVGGLTLNRHREREAAEKSARNAVAGASKREEVALLLQVLSDLEDDLDTIVRHCDFEGDPDNLILEGWLQARGGFTGMAASLRMAKRLPILRKAGLVGPAMKAKATAYYYWRAMAGLDHPAHAEARAGRPDRQHYEDPKIGVLSSLFRKIQRNGPKALRVGNIIVDSAIAILEIPAVKGVVAAADGATSGLVTPAVMAAKTAAHGTSEIKKIVEESKPTKFNKKAKRGASKGSTALVA